VCREWEAAAEAQYQQQQQKLEADLTNSKANMVKESVRMAHRDLGDFYYKFGDLQVCGNLWPRHAPLSLQGHTLLSLIITSTVCLPIGLPILPLNLLCDD
jgi:hypothetical protein